MNPRIELALYLITAILLLPFGSTAAPANREGVILIITSCAPNAPKIASFLHDFEQEIGDSKIPYDIFIESIDCRNTTDASEWTQKVNRLIHHYQKHTLKAVILLGGEAWSACLTAGYFPKDVLFFGGFTGCCGILLPSGTVSPEENWDSPLIEYTKLLDTLENGGGFFSHYDIGRNIDLIRSLYPEVTDIAFISDNTYEGLSLQAQAKRDALRYPELRLTLIDSRDGEEYARKIVNGLPEKSAVLVGYWQVGPNGQYFPQSALSELTERNPPLPVFSVSGTGIGTTTIGGYVPVFEDKAKMIARQIVRAHKNPLPKAKYEIIDGEYRFDSKKLREMKISEDSLPQGSIVGDTVFAKLEKYSHYIDLLILLVAILIVLSIVLVTIGLRTNALKRNLERREGELIDAKARAEESDMLKSAFLANMSHEIRTPLNAIMGFSSLMQDSELTEEERAEYSALVVNNSEMLLTLLNDILDISQLECGRIKFKYGHEDIVHVCQHVILTTAHTRAPGVEMIFKPSCTSYTLYTDGQRLSQILINLLTNAAKFTTEGSITLASDVREEQGQVVFSVTDTGPGIPPDKQKQIFNRFEKLGKKKGTGLGLAICRQIAIVFGGSIFVDPEYSDGARFVFIHPIKKASKEDFEAEFSGGGF